MKVLLAILAEAGLREALRAGTDVEDVLIVESTVDGAARRLIAIRADVLIVDETPLIGANALEALRAAAPRTPIIVLSSRSDLAAQAALRKAGAADVLIKPFSVEALRHAVCRLAAPSAPAPQAAVPQHLRDEQGDSLAQHRMALRWIGRAAADPGDWTRLAERLVEAALDIFDAVRCAVLLETDGRVTVAASHGVADTVCETLRLGYESGLMRCFDDHASLFEVGVIHPEDQGARIRERAEAERQLLLLGGRVAAPLLRCGRVFGALVLGEKATSGGFSREERELLALVARCASTLLEVPDHARQSAMLPSNVAAHIVEALPWGIAFVDGDEQISLLTRRAAEILGIPRAGLQGQHATALGRDVSEAILDTLADGLPRRGLRISGAATLSVEPMPGMGALALVEQFRETEPQSEREAAQVAESPFWEYLSSRVAQEIKNPMVAINTFAQLLPRKYDSEEFREAFGRVVQKEVQRINSVVETLFAFARTPTPETRPCNLNQTVSDVLRSFEEELAARRIVVETRWEATGAEALLDPVYFSQALHNVVQNAIEAMPDGGRIRVETRRENGSAEILVSDSGPGVAPEHEPSIFLPFFSTKERGMGLGLAIASRILRQHRGSLAFQRDPVGGGGFLFQLPVQPAGPADLAKKDTSEQ